MGAPAGSWDGDGILLSLAQHPSRFMAKGRRALGDGRRGRGSQINFMLESDTALGRNS